MYSGADLCPKTPEAVETCNWVKKIMETNSMEVLEEFFALKDLSHENHDTIVCFLIQQGRFWIAEEFILRTKATWPWRMSNLAMISGSVSTLECLRSRDEAVYPEPVAIMDAAYMNHAAALRLVHNWRPIGCLPDIDIADMIACGAYEAAAFLGSIGAFMGPKHGTAGEFEFNFNLAAGMGDFPFMNLLHELWPHHQPSPWAIGIVIERGRVEVLHWLTTWVTPFEFCRGAVAHAALNGHHTMVRYVFERFGAMCSEDATLQGLALDGNTAVFRQRYYDQGLCEYSIQGRQNARIFEDYNYFPRPLNMYHTHLIPKWECFRNKPQQTPAGMQVRVYAPQQCIQM